MKLREKNGTLIMFICNHCPYVKAVIKDVVEDVNFLESLGIKSAAIMSNDVKNYPEDSFENMMSFSKSYNFSFPYLIDDTQKVAKNMERSVHLTFLVITRTLNFNTEVE